MKIIVNTNSVSAKLEAAEKALGEAMLGKVTAAARTAVQASPVDTGAFVESWSVVPSGSGGGRSRSSKAPGRYSLPESAKQAVKDEQKQVVASDVRKHSKVILEKGIAVIRNRAPHQPYIKQWGTIVSTVRDTHG